jgi:AcrR family transcriptional regulator
MATRTLRARVREEITEEILAVARRHLATDGANLSLRAVARDAGMVPSALYRYFPSRDALLTALITEAYQSLAAAAEDAEAAVSRDRPRARWLALGNAVRTWALKHPAEYALIYGSPVPGYAAPPDTVAPASRVLITIITILSEHPPAARPLPPAVEADFRHLRAQWPEAPAEPVLATAFTLWTQLLGLTTFESFGRLDNLIEARADYFTHQLDVMADLASLPED